jgi:hypothetical protein
MFAIKKCTSANYTPQRPAKHTHSSSPTTPCSELTPVRWMRDMYLDVKTPWRGLKLAGTAIAARFTALPADAFH